MPTGRNPDNMTTDERRDEVASILAGAMLRTTRSQRGTLSNLSKTRESRDSGLDLCANSPLSVAPRPAG
ncbi:MAG: hypothetical protein QF561_07215 [Phycisphaerales bacterium]|jgi:hypothetical protein|nr:hypothetical protein [Phycisphaerales bacterium]